MVTEAAVTAQLQPTETIEKPMTHIKYRYPAIGDRFIECVATGHTSVPESPQIAVIQNDFEKFVEITPDQKRVVLYEGGQITDQKRNKTESVLAYGEAGLVEFLARTNTPSIEAQSPEPSEKDEVTHLVESGLTREEIELYNFVRAVDQYNRTDGDTRGSLDEYCARYLNRNLDQFSTTEPLTTDRLKEIYQEKLGEQFDAAGPTRIHELTNPTNESTVVNQVSKLSSDYRDTFIAKVLEEKWQEGYAIFLVYGTKHVTALEGKIREISQN